MKGFLIRFIIFLLFALFAYAIWNHRLIVYGIQQLKGQLHIITNTRSVEDIISEKAVKQEYISKLLLIQQIRKFAIDSLGLYNSSNYTTYYDQLDKPVLWVLTACPQFEMKPYEWYFPFLGNSFFYCYKNYLQTR